ncbi:phage major tail tube protein [Pandoraea sp. ISTKB]|uniref:phage major tail tube protein n=1 Tax=Pandoraea sp. ISTKB TaxID=1586708 RepID=UPI000846E67A|nr:phage major tail tube protein [Pandoraea sp. ISTKB]ODP33064.1 phage major tail tube protein [Pandoraea sp. ISTKB]
MIPETFVNFNLFVDGTSFAGVANSVTPPKLKIKTDEHRGGGMDAPVKMDMGMEALEGAFSMSSMRVEVLKFFGLTDGEAFNGVFRGAFRDQRGKVKSVVLTMRGSLTEHDSGEWKPGEKVDVKYTPSLTYYKLEIDGQTVYEIDVIAGVRIVNGVDQLKDVRQALGM